ncbi:unnamed protein product [Plutella xylostella]|uniref:Ribonuclease H2 subunit B n=1 Tax=Plutella xylostella TaxID=51655 RepID=A0A8S4E019_PLUXY|nr:unnamed protein product [Plutella xylostella]
MTTRSKKKPATDDTKKTIMKRVENSWILIAKDSLLENSNFSIVTLPHPSRGEPTKYCLDDDHSKMFEVVTFDEPHRSWFIGDTVKSDGSLLICSPVNPIFLVLPRLKEQCSNRAVPLEDLLSEKGFDKIIDFIPDLDKVADLKGPADIKAYKYNEEKTLSWLEQRVRRVATVLKDKNIHVRSGAVSATFIASQVDGEAINEEFYLKYAHGLVSEYLEDDLMEALEKRFNFTPELVETLAKKRKSEAQSHSPNKKTKHDTSVEDLKESSILSPTQNLPDLKKQKPISAKEKARQKAASGTKTISSFFTKK